MGVYDELDKLLPKAMKRHEVPGASVAVMRNHRITKTASAGVINLNTRVKVNDESVFQVGSISKPFTATIIMQLVDEGKIELDAPVRRYLKDFRVLRHDVSRKVTIRQLLSHTSGIDGDFFEDSGRGDDATEKLLKMATMLPSLFEPGEMMSYCNIGYAALGRVIEVITGDSYDAAIRRRLFEPLGMERAFTLPEDSLKHRSAIGHVPGSNKKSGWQVANQSYLAFGQKAAGSTPSMTASELLRFASMHMNKGLNREGDKVLSRKSVQNMQRGQISLLKHAGRNVRQWGLGWFLCDWQGSRLYGHDGATIGQYAFLRVLPEKGLAVAMLTNGGYAGDLYKEIFGHLFSRLAGTSESNRPTDLAKQPDDLAPYLGVYENIQAELHVEEQIKEKGNRLYLTQRLKAGGNSDVADMPLTFFDRHSARLDSGNPRLDVSTFLFSQPVNEKMQFLGSGFRQFRRKA